MALPALEKNDYEQRKQWLEDSKTLTKDQYHEVFRIIRKANVEYSENGNGIFFDLSNIKEETFQELVKYLELSKQQQKNEEDRKHEMDLLRHEAKET